MEARNEPPHHGRRGAAWAKAADGRRSSRAQYQEDKGEGVVLVGTAGHGGAWVSREALARMPKWLKRPNRFYPAGSQWFEEDVEMARVILAFPHLFKPGSKEEAAEILRAFHPELFEVRRESEAEESLREEEARAVEAEVGGL